jgi:hypothetical protein
MGYSLHSDDSEYSANETVKRLRRAVSDGREVCVTLDDGHEIRGKAVQETVDRPLAEKVDGQSPPHGLLVVDVWAYEGELPGVKEPRNVIIDVGEDGDGGWSEDGMRATWQIAVDDGEEEKRAVGGVEVVSDE